MSGIVKSVKKVFKKVGSALKKIAKPVAIAAAVYFTGGLALSAFPATAGFAASLPGFAGAAGAGTGIFSTVATKLGLGAGLKAGAATAAGAIGSGVGGAAAAAGSAGGIGGAAGFTGGISGLGAVGGSASGAAVAAGMSLSEKLIVAQLGTQALSGLLQPKQSEVLNEQAKFRGAFYGNDSTVTAPDPVTAQAQKKIEPPKPAEAMTPAQPPGAVASAKPVEASGVDSPSDLFSTNPTQAIESQFTPARQLFG